MPQMLALKRCSPQPWLNSFSVSGGIAVIISTLLGICCHGAVIAANSLRIIEGDILVSHNPYSRAIGVPAAHQAWIDGVIPYRIEPSVPASSVQAIKSAISRWNALSVVTLVAVDGNTANSDLLTSSDDLIVFQTGPGCASWVGRRGGAQEIWVAPNCTTGSVMHEIGHALGLEHEHTRPDRDQYITINWGNVDPAKTHNFDVAPRGSRALGEYDYESIMHYGPKNFSINQQATIVPRYVPIEVIGQRRSPSEGDLEAIAQLYATDLSVVTHVYPFEQTSEIALHISNDGAQGAHAIRMSVEIGDASLLDYRSGQWQCDESAAGVVDCSLARLASGAQSVLLLNLDKTVMADAVTAQLGSKTRDTNLQNNTNSALHEPSLAAAFGSAQDDPVQSQVFGGACAPGLLLLLLWLQWQPRRRIYGCT